MKLKEFEMETYSYPKKVHGEATVEPSNTVPNDSLTIREILDRHIKGLPYKTFEPVYDDLDVDDDYSQPEDTVDAYDMVDAVDTLRNIETMQAIAKERKRQQSPTKRNDVISPSNNDSSDVETK